jgi:hypothetical protein
MLFHGLALAVVGFYKNATVAHRRLGLGESIQLHLFLQELPKAAIF